LKTPVTIALDALDFRQLIGAGETVGWAEATAEPLFLTRLLNSQAEDCLLFRVFFPLTFKRRLCRRSSERHHHRLGRRQRREAIFC
jgi:hypothetical protein